MLFNAISLHFSIQAIMFIFAFKLNNFNNLKYNPGLNYIDY